MTERFKALVGETAEEAMAFLGSFKTLQMATASASGEPEASYAPFVRTGDNAFYICVSDLSRHTGHLVTPPDVRASSSSRTSPRPPSSSLSRRLVFECGAEQVERGTERWYTTMDRLRTQVRGSDRPHSSARGLPDVRPQLLVAGVFVKGFGQALSHRRSRPSMRFAR